MSEQAGMPGELVYEHAVQIKQVAMRGGQRTARRPCFACAVDRPG